MASRVMNPGGMVKLWLLMLLIVELAFGPRALGGTAGEEKQQNQAEADALFNGGSLHRLQIEVSWVGLQSLRLAPRRYVKATLREGTLVFTNVQVRLKGGAGSFRGVDDKPGLTLKLEEKGPRFHGLKKFHLNNSVQDKTYLSEWTIGELFREAGVPAARAAHAVVELNGRRLGLYVLMEGINADFLSRYFAETHGNVYSLSANADITGPLEQNGGKEETNRAELRSLAAAARLPDLEKMRARLPQVLDLPRFLSFMALEAMLDHWDGYTCNVKNYLVYHDPGSNRIVFIPHDLDQLLRNPGAPIIPNAQGMVARAILRHPRLRAQYEARFIEIYGQFFQASVLARRIDEKVAQLTPELKSYNPVIAEKFVTRAASLKGRIAGRSRALAEIISQMNSSR